MASPFAGIRLYLREGIVEQALEWQVYWSTVDFPYLERIARFHGLLRCLGLKPQRLVSNPSIPMLIACTLGKLLNLQLSPVVRYFL